jgi:hypothetical protein
LKTDGTISPDAHFLRKRAGVMGFCRFERSGADVRIFGYAHVAQLAEHVLGKDEVISSILIMGSR